MVMAKGVKATRPGKRNLGFGVALQDCDSAANHVKKMLLLGIAPSCW